MRPFVFSLTFNAYKVTGQFPWSSLRETDRGISAELSVNICLFPFYLLLHVLLISQTLAELFFFMFFRNIKIKFVHHLLHLSCTINHLFSIVPIVEDQSDTKVGRSMERTRLPGSHCLVCHPRGERTLPQVLTFGICLIFYMSFVFHI